MDRKISAFYGDISLEQKEKLKKNAGIHLHMKPISGLINKNKRVLVCFLPGYHEENGLLKLYQEIIGNKTKPAGIEKVVFVLLVSSQTQDIHSTSFAIEKDRLQRRISNDFSTPAKVIVKNPESPDKEVIRNLKIELDKYRVKDIEVVDINFKPDFARWIIEATNDYVIWDTDRNYYFIQG